MYIVDRARDQKAARQSTIEHSAEPIVALKKVRMEREKNGALKSL